MRYNGWTGRPGGIRNPSGSSVNVGLSGYWWSVTEDGAANAVSRFLSFNLLSIIKQGRDKNTGMSVRCIGD